MDSGVLATNVLLVEDNPGDARLVCEHLAEGVFGRFAISIAGSMGEALARLKKERFDVVLLDLTLPDIQDLDTVIRLQTEEPTVPIVVLSGHDDEALALEAVHAGAQDYLVKGKGDSDTLVRAIRHAIERKDLSGELIQANEELRRNNQKLSELYDTAHQFVDDVSHEFRTPLTVIKEFASILLDGLAGELSEQQREYLNIIQNRTDDLGFMVNDMLDTSKLEAGLLSLVRAEHRLGAIIANVRTVLERKAAASNVKLDIAIPDDLPTIYCDAEKIGRVVINLCVNACKFSGENGEVRLWAREGDGDGNIVVGVTDNGPGIAAEELNAIFERFRQVGRDIRASTKGFGLGLNIVRELVTLNLGDIHVDSEQGSGSTFWFTIPVYNPVANMNRFVRRIKYLRDSASIISLCVAEAVEATTPELLEDTSKFLQQQLRRHDLAFEAGDGRWILCVATSLGKIDKMISRLLEVRADVNRNRPTEKLPEIAINHLGSWELPGEGDALLARFNEALAGDRN